MSKTIKYQISRQVASTVESILNEHLKGRTHIIPIDYNPETQKVTVDIGINFDKDKNISLIPIFYGPITKDTPIKDCNLSPNIVNRFTNTIIDEDDPISTLSNYSKTDLLKIRMLGNKLVNDLEKFCNSIGVYFKEENDDKNR